MFAALTNTAITNRASARYPRTKHAAALMTRSSGNQADTHFRHQGEMFGCQLPKCNGASRLHMQEACSPIRLVTRRTCIGIGRALHKTTIFSLQDKLHFMPHFASRQYDKCSTWTLKWSSWHELDCP